MLGNSIISNYGVVSVRKTILGDFKMGNLKVGFGCANINPPMGIPLRGYFKERLAEGIIDDLEINALAIECNGERVLLKA